MLIYLSSAACLDSSFTSYVSLLFLLLPLPIPLSRNFFFLDGSSSFSSLYCTSVNSLFYGFVFLFSIFSSSHDGLHHCRNCSLVCQNSPSRYTFPKVGNLTTRLRCVSVIKAKIWKPVALKTWNISLFSALRYKPAGRAFDSRWCHWNFSVT